MLQSMLKLKKSRKNKKINLYRPKSRKKTHKRNNLQLLNTKSKRTLKCKMKHKIRRKHSLKKITKNKLFNKI